MQIVKLAAACGFAAAVCAAACADSSHPLNPTAPSATATVDAQTLTSGGVSTSMGKPTTTPGNGNANGNGNGGGNNNAGGNGNGNAGGNGNGNAGGNGNGNAGGNGNGNPGGTDHGPGTNNAGGNGNGNGNGHSDQPSVNGQPTTSTHPAPVHTKVEIEGLIGSIGADQISVAGQSVSVTSATVIRHDDMPVAFGDLQSGDRVHVKATRVTSGSSTTLEANEVNLQNPVGHDDDDDEDPTEPIDPALPLVAVVAVDATAIEGTTDKAIFLLTRSGATTAALTVTITLTGTATNGVDYESVPVTVTFLAGAATANVEIVAKADATIEGAESVILIVVDGTGYYAGAPAAATVGIAE